MLRLSDCAVPGKKFSVWFTQGFSSQRDMLLALQASSLAPCLFTIASHHQARDEILSAADLGLREPAQDYVAFVLQQAINRQVQLVMASHHPHHYEAVRGQFEQHGIALLTGTRGTGQHARLENKLEFSRQCQQAGIPVVESIGVDSTAGLIAAIDQLKLQHPVICVKPVTGVFAQGFWQLRDDLDYFHALYNPSEFCANTRQFIEAYDQQAQKRPYLVMPYLPGNECSVDVFCVQGELKRAVTRIKQAHWQTVMPEGPCDSLARQLAAEFCLDGLVNIQCRQDAQANWRVLEINARPSGGIALTLHSGVNLVAECLAYFANVPLVRPTAKIARVRLVSQPVELASGSAQADAYQASADQASADRASIQQATVQQACLAHALPRPVIGDEPAHA